MPAHALADIHAAAAAALRDPQMRGVQWNFGGSVEPVSAFLDLEHDDAMVFILEQIALLTEADLCAP